MVRGDCQATVASNYTVERLTRPNTAGTLDQVGEPHGLSIADDGSVFYIGKAACPTGPVVSWDDPDVGLGCGTIHRWDPGTRTTKLLTTLEVMGNRGSGSELVKNEEGLVGIALDPDFATNHWIYAYWMPHESIDRDLRIGQRTVSRFTYDPVADSIDQSTRTDLLSWPTQIHSCCHAGGGMAFDKAGNLYVGSGDSNSSQGSSGYSGNNWTADYKGMSFQDARRTVGQHQRPQRQDPADPPRGRRRLHDPRGQPVHRRRGRRWQGPPGDLRHGRPQHLAAGHRRRQGLADRRLGRPRRLAAQPHLGPGEVRHGDGHHLRRQPGLALLHGQPAALPRPEQHRRHPAGRLVRLRQPEEHLAAQHRPGGHPAGPRQRHLVLPRRRRTGLPGARGRQRRPDVRSLAGDLHRALDQGRRPGRHVRPHLPPVPGRRRERRRVAVLLGGQVVHRRPVQRQQPPRRDRSTRPRSTTAAGRPSPRTCARSCPAARATTS